jgi:hypothetical protein
LPTPRGLRMMRALDGLYVPSALVPIFVTLVPFFQFVKTFGESSRCGSVEEIIAALPREYEFHVGLHRCVMVEPITSDVEMCEPSKIGQVLFTCKAQFVQACVEMVLHEAAAHGVTFEEVKWLFFERRCEVCGSGAGGAARVRVVMDAV